MSAFPVWWAPLLSKSTPSAAVGVLDSDTPHLIRHARLRIPEDARPASVLVLLAETEQGPSVLLQQRADGLRHHPGQIAFPGGAADPGDTGPADTALREAAEEIAVEPASVDIGGTMPPLWIPVSGFSVTPVLAWWRAPHPVAPVDTDEVAAVHLVGLNALADPAARGSVRYPSGHVGPGFQITGVPLIWGFTAGVLSWLLDLGGWARPWNTKRMMELERF
jgi:8-oxo-dGTP pyrophosphatase MutT (NUDIX family)